MTSLAREQIGNDAAEVSGEMPLLARKVIHFVMENFAEEVSLDDLAEAAGLSKFNFCRRFQKECGLTPMRWLWAFRSLLAAEFIRVAPQWSLTDVAFSCGFTSSAHFSRLFKQVVGVNPSSFRKQMLAKAENALGSGQSFDALFQDNALFISRAAQGALQQSIH